MSAFTPLTEARLSILGHDERKIIVRGTATEPVLLERSFMLVG
jgi:hypothetical protein